jgi:hypothetical protein
MTKIVINRHQYGVGQGGFHFQEISLADPKSKPSSFRFAYDCGGKKEFVKWGIKHATSGYTNPTLDSVYISHFEFDHVNGLEELCKTATVNRFFVPYIGAPEAIHLIAKQLEAGVEITLEYVSVLFAVARGESIYGVPVTRIEAGGENPPSFDQDQPQSAQPESDNTFVVEIPNRNSLTNNDAIRLKIGKQVIWEVIHWCYAPYKDLSEHVVVELKRKFSTFESEILPGFLNGATADQANKSGNWILKHRNQIRDCYNQVIEEINSSLIDDQKIPSDHNVVSLCLFSGPTSKPPYPRHKTYVYNSFPKIFPPLLDFISRTGAWLGTGDAMLKRDEVWGPFKSFFGSRLNECRTIIIPHHGANSNKSDNYRKELVRRRRICVISAGAKNSYHHPHISVVQHILEKGGILQLVSENNPLGFVEHLTVDI